jgi:hypothetical protein
MIHIALLSKDKTSAKRKFKFKRDTYTRARGTPVMLTISCSLCETYLMSYQKDGPGPLKCCYIDRIHHPEEPGETSVCPVR